MPTAVAAWNHEAVDGNFSSPLTGLYAYTWGYTRRSLPEVNVHVWQKAVRHKALDEAAQRAHLPIPRLGVASVPKPVPLAGTLGVPVQAGDHEAGKVHKLQPAIAMLRTI